METLSTQVQGNIYATLQKITPTDTVVDNFVTPLAFNLTSGVGPGSADQIFGGQFTLPANGSTTYNLANYDGVTDGVGGLYSQATVKLFFVQNTSGTSTNTLSVSGVGAGANGWTSCFTGTHVLNGDNGYLLISSPGGTGFPCPPGNEHFKVATTSAAPITYNLLIVGASRPY